MSNVSRRKYKKKAGTAVTAVQLNLETSGFEYHKWGGTQVCKPGDWIVHNQDDCYTVDCESFARTYTMISPGLYQKTQAIWAEVSASAGTVATKEGATRYKAGDYLVSNNADGSDAYAIGKSKFEETYEPAD